jgi:AraC-like DNA-binding protein
MKYHYIEGEWINALMRTFANLGVDIQQVIRGIEGFDHQRVTAGYRLDINAARKMWHRADELAQDPLLGLKIGSVQDYRAIGVIAPVIWHSPSVRAAINHIEIFQTLISESGTYRINEIQDGKGSVIYCEYVALPSSVPANAHQILAVAVGTIGIIRAISNNVVKVRRLYLPPKLDADLIAQHLGCDVVNREGNLAISFCSEAVDIPLLGCDNNLYQINMAYAEELLRVKKAGSALIDSVKSSIKHSGFSQASIEDVELLLGSHKRTLQRNLLVLGTSFRQLKEEVLKEFSTSLLLNDKIAIESLAEHLGYSEPSAFHRAFKSWFGVTPRQFCRLRHYQ